MEQKLNAQITRRTLLGAAGGVSALALAGALPRVALGQSPEAAAVTPYNGEEVTITYGFWDTAQEAAITAQLDAFKVAFPNITVEPQIVPWADYWTKLQTGVAGGETFDVFWINSASLPVYASAGALLPIDSIVGGDGGVDLANFAAPLVEMYQWDGSQYGIPRDFDTIALFYNKDIFDAAGVAYPDDTWTWETFRSVSEQLTDADAGVWGAGLQTSWQENYYNFIYQNGGTLLNDDLTESTVGSPEASEAFVYLAGFFSDELTPSIAIQQSNPVADSLFPAGQVAMLPGGSFRAGTYGAADANIDVAPLPQGKERATVTHGLANVIWASGWQSRRIARAGEVPGRPGSREHPGRIGRHHSRLRRTAGALAGRQSGYEPAGLHRRARLRPQGSRSAGRLRVADQDPGSRDRRLRRQHRGRGDRPQGRRSGRRGPLTAHLDSKTHERRYRFYSGTGVSSPIARARSRPRLGHGNLPDSNRCNRHASQRPPPASGDAPARKRSGATR